MRKRQQSTKKEFMKLSVEEMSAQVRARDETLQKRNCLLVVLFLFFSVVIFGIGMWFYGGWVMETAGAFWQFAVLIWQFEWWEAGSILFQYRLSFFLMGIFVGFFLFIFIVFQIGEMLLELIWDTITGFFG